MREIRLSGSEGGGAEFNRLSLPLFKTPSPCPLPGGEGEAKAIAAAKVGLSKPTAEKAVVVVQKIDEAEAAGNTTKAAERRQELNKGSVAAPHRKVTGQADAPSGQPAAPAGNVLDGRRPVPESACEPPLVLSIRRSCGHSLSGVKRTRVIDREFSGREREKQRGRLSFPTPRPESQTRALA